MAAKGKHVAVYVRVSSNKQEFRSQMPELDQWASAQDLPVKWYQDKFSGRTMDRPGWGRLEQQLRLNRVAKLVVWRLDRLGRNVAGLSQLFDTLVQQKVVLVSLRDGLDLSTPAGRLVANVMASVASYEREVIGERVRSGQAAARKAGKTWGGSKPGVRRKVTANHEKTIRMMHQNGQSIREITSVVGLARNTVRSVLTPSTNGDTHVR